MNDSRPLDPLIHLLGRESAQCELLAQNILQEREAMKRMALHEFVAINHTRISILECLSGLKEEVDAFVRDLTAADVQETAQTLPDILRRMRSLQADAVLQQYERLAERVRTVRRDIAVNQLLVKNIQSFIARALEAHRQPDPESEVYSISGGRNTGAPASLIRRKG